MSLQLSLYWAVVYIRLVLTQALTSSPDLSPSSSLHSCLVITGSCLTLITLT